MSLVVARVPRPRTGRKPDAEGPFTASQPLPEHPLRNHGHLGGGVKTPDDVPSGELADPAGQVPWRHLFAGAEADALQRARVRLHAVGMCHVADLFRGAVADAFVVEPGITCESHDQLGVPKGE